MRPTVGAMAVLIKDEKVVLVRRSKDPDARRWSLPAGKIEPGEPIRAAALRELAEETAIRATAGQVLTTVEAIARDPSGTVRHRNVIVAVACTWISGDPMPSDDASDARWFSPSELESLELASGFDVAEVVKLALAARSAGAIR